MNEFIKNNSKIDDKEIEIKWGNVICCKNSLFIEFKNVREDIGITDLEFREYFNLGDPKNIFDAKLIYSGCTFKGHGFVTYKPTPSGEEVC
jgi:hypothetical protein